MTGYRVVLALLLLCQVSCNLLSSERGFHLNRRDTQRGTECYGSLPAMSKLETIGISQEDLLRGVGCGVADFDGNGAMDYFFYNAHAEPGARGSHSGRVLVLFRDANGSLLRTTLLGKRFSHRPQVYRSEADSRTIDKFRAAGCPVRMANDGILEPGVRSASYVFLWSKSEGRFDTFSCRPQDVQNGE